MRPGNTVAIALTAGYQRLATLYGSSDPERIKSPDGKEVANQVLISVTTQAGEIAFNSALPMVTGHPLAAGDSMTMANQGYTSRAWLRGTSGAILMITPIFE